jgi:hypothetical protein
MDYGGPIMDDIVVLGRDEDRHSVQRFLAHYDVPAYVRRARGVEEAFDLLLGRCRQQREEMLSVVRTRIGLLKALAGAWDVLQPFLKDSRDISTLRDLHASLAPKLRFPPGPSSSSRALRRALQELCESLLHFNQRWQAFLQTVDLTPINELRDAYNRYYLLEKECALRSARLARQGFRRLDPLTLDELAALLPALPVPQLVE